MRHPGLIVKDGIKLSNPDEMLLLMRWIRRFILRKMSGCVGGCFRISIPQFKAWLRSNGIEVRQRGSILWPLFMLELALLRKAGYIRGYEVLRTDKTIVIVKRA